jgi:hypothetical protein
MPDERTPPPPSDPPEGVSTPARGRMAKGTSSYGPSWRYRTHWWNRKPPRNEPPGLDPSEPAP